MIALLERDGGDENLYLIGNVLGAASLIKLSFLKLIKMWSWRPTAQVRYAASINTLYHLAWEIQIIQVLGGHADISVVNAACCMPDNRKAHRFEFLHRNGWMLPPADHIDLPKLLNGALPRNQVRCWMADSECCISKILFLPLVFNYFTSCFIYFSHHDYLKT